MTVVFDHIAVGAQRIADATPFLVGELGGVSGYGGPTAAYRFWHWDYPGPGRIEVLEPNGPDGGFLHRFLDRQGPGIHHVTFNVPSLRATCDRAESLDYSILDYDDRNPRWQEAFLHPKQAMGIVVQMVASEPGADEGEGERGVRAAPPQPADPPPPVTVVGLRMRSADPERAVRQWSELLKGELDEGEGELRFTWPGSGMRIAVTIEPDARDASEAIELRAERALRLPEGPHPLLGAVFRQLPHRDE